MKVNKKLLGPFLAFIIVLGIGTAFVIAQTNTDKVSIFHKDYFKSKFTSDLTEEQISLLHQTKMDLKEEGATWEEMHEAMQVSFDEWNIETPEWGYKSMHGFGGNYLSGKSFGEGCSYNKEIVE